MPRLTVPCSVTALGLTLALAACSPTATPPALPEVTISASDSSVVAPSTLQSGLVAVTLKNTGARTHYAEFARLKAGATLAQVQSALTAGDFATLDTLVAESGATADVDAGGSNRVILDLAAGTYLLLDDAVKTDDPPVIAGSVTVTQRTGLAVPDPTTDVKVVGKDFAYDMPMTIAAGNKLWQFVNAGQESHEVTIVKLHDGKTVADAKAFLDQPNPDFNNAPGDFITEIAPLAGGVREFVNLNLTAGNYVALCGIPDPASGKPHFDLGMIMGFTVTGSN